MKGIVVSVGGITEHTAKAPFSQMVWSVRTAFVEIGDAIAAVSQGLAGLQNTESGRRMSSFARRSKLDQIFPLEKLICTVQHVSMCQYSTVPI